MMTKTVSVPSISCGHCVMTIQREVGDLQGVSAVKADKDTKQVTISWDPHTTDWVVIEDTMKEIDFPPVA
ncbi:MAG: heavy-metal-associated domain-containing protein [Longimicrobiales bacterium]|nr:heavy-metal-associated domain-containing protein [Longimicrobiales bacterium]